MRYSLVFSQWRVWCMRKSAIRSSSVTPRPVTSITFLRHRSNALVGLDPSGKEGGEVCDESLISRLYFSFLEFLESMPDLLTVPQRLAVHPHLKPEHSRQYQGWKILISVDTNFFFSLYISSLHLHTNNYRITVGSLSILVFHLVSCQRSSKTPLTNG